MSAADGSPVPAGSAPGGAPEQQVQQLLALNQASVAITGELEVESLLQLIVDVARTLVGCRYAALGVLGEDGYIARFPTSGLSPHEQEQIGAPPRGHGLLEVMLRAGRTLRIPDIRLDPRRIGFPPHHPPMTSLLGVPIWIGGRLVGDLYLSDKIGRAEFGEEDEWIVQLLATHAATALTKAQLHAENVEVLARVRRERAGLQALYRVTQAINRAVDLQEVIALVTQAAVDLLDVAGAAVHLLEHPTAPDLPTDSTGAAHFVARYASGLAEPVTTEAAQLPMDRSLAGRAVQTGITQVVQDTAQEPDTVFPVLAGKPLRSLVAVPLVASGQTLGVLSAYADRPDAFDAEAVQLLEAFGAAASTAIHNAELYEEARLGRAAAEREQERLREIEHMKDEFLSTAAHELRTPLTTIRISAGLAHEQMLLQTEVAMPGAGFDPRLVHLVGLVVESSERMQALVNDLLDLTRLEHGRTSLHMESLDLREVVRASVDATRPLFEARDQPLAAHLPEAYCGVRGDRPRLEQVVINLLSNASKYSPPGAPVEVRIVRAGAACCVTVRDHGPGVPPEEREQIFERFYRSSHHRNDRTASTGLGLPIARRIAEMHRGRVGVELAPGGGSIFTLALPFAG